MAIKQSLIDKPIFSRLATLMLVMSAVPNVASGDEGKSGIDKYCSAGDKAPWTLPPTTDQYKVSEQYISINGDTTVTYRVCQCTDDLGGQPPAVWVTSYIEKDVVTLLRGKSCVDLHGKQIWVHHEDKSNGRWGVYSIEK